MHNDDDRLRFAPQEFRDYLLLLARLWLPRHLQRRMDASDLVQVAHTKAFENARQFRGQNPNQYKAWLRQILKNTLLDALKKHGRDGEQSAQFLSDSSCRLEARLADNEPTASARAALREELDQIAALLAQLPEDQQQALVMKYCLGLKVGQIAEETGRTRASVAGLLRRGLKHLRGKLVES